MKELHKGAKWLFRVRGYLVLFFLLIWLFPLLIIGNQSDQNREKTIFTGVGYILPLFILFVVALSEVYARLAYKNWKYELGERELKLEKGIIFKTYKSVPYERVQNVDINRGILARMLGFSTLDIHTAGYHISSGRNSGASSEGHIPAVSVQEAEKIREFLMNKIGRGQGL